MMTAEQTGEIASSKYQLDIGRLTGDMIALDQQFNYQKDLLSSANEKYLGDSILYKNSQFS